MFAGWADLKTTCGVQKCTLAKAHVCAQPDFGSVTVSIHPPPRSEPPLSIFASVQLEQVPWTPLDAIKPAPSTVETVWAEPRSEGW